MTIPSHNFDLEEKMQDDIQWPQAAQQSITFLEEENDKYKIERDKFESENIKLIEALRDILAQVNEAGYYQRTQALARRAIGRAPESIKSEMVQSCEASLIREATQAVERIQVAIYWLNNAKSTPISDLVGSE